MDAPTFLGNTSEQMETHIRYSMGCIAQVPDVSDVLISTERRTRYAILISMYEVYNDRIFDLLDESTYAQPQARRKPLAFRKCSSWDHQTDKDKRVVAGLQKVWTRTLDEALQVIEHGQACRHMSPTSSNESSSRSHAFFAIEIKRFSSKTGAPLPSGTFHVVDLAGSERSRHAKTQGDRLAEAGSINRSLMSLGQCLQLQLQFEKGKVSPTPAIGFLRHIRGIGPITSGHIARRCPVPSKQAHRATFLEFLPRICGPESCHDCHRRPSRGV